MTRLVINDVADRDADDIYTMLCRSSGLKTAVAFDRAFDALFVRLIQFPESGAPRRKLGPIVRIGVVRPFVILYRYDRVSDVVEILRILDGRRDIKPRLLPA